MDPGQRLWEAWWHLAVVAAWHHSGVGFDVLGGGGRVSRLCGGFGGSETRGLLLCRTTNAWRHGGVSLDPTLQRRCLGVMAAVEESCDGVVLLQGPMGTDRGARHFG